MTNQTTSSEPNKKPIKDIVKEVNGNDDKSFSEKKVLDVNNQKVVSMQGFVFADQTIRVEMINGEPWFIAKDVCDILGIKNSRHALILLDADEKGVILTDTPGGKQEMATVNESGLYSLIMNSRKPEAKAFRKWVTSEVLPAIRKDGGYMIAKPEETPEELALRALTVLQATVERQKAMLAVATPKAAALDILAEKEGSYCITDAAKLLQIRPSELFDYLQAHGWIYRRMSSNEYIGYQRHLVNGDLEHKVTTITTNFGEKSRYQVRVKHKGLTVLARLLNPGSGEDK